MMAEADGSVKRRKARGGVTPDIPASAPNSEVGSKLDADFGALKIYFEHECSIAAPCECPSARWLNSYKTRKLSSCND